MKSSRHFSISVAEQLRPHLSNGPAGFLALQRIVSGRPAPADDERSNTFAIETEGLRYNVAITIDRMQHQILRRELFSEIESLPPCKISRLSSKERTGWLVARVTKRNAIGDVRKLTVEASRIALHSF